MEPISFEPRTIGQIFRTTFALYRRHFWHFIAIVAVIELPLALFAASSSALRARGIEARRNPDSTQVQGRAPQSLASSDAVEPEGDEVAGKRPFAWETWGVRMALIGFQIAIQTFAFGALMVAVSALKAGTEMTVRQAYGLIRPKVLPLGCAGILVSLLVALGICILVFPGIVFLLWFALTLPCVVAEDLGVIGAMRRSRALVWGHMGKVFGVALVVNLVNFGIGILLSYAVYHSAKSVLGANLPLTWFASVLVSRLGHMSLAPIGAIALVLLYFDLRSSEDRLDEGLLPEEMQIRT